MNEGGLKKVLYTFFRVSENDTGKEAEVLNGYAI